MLDKHEDSNLNFVQLATANMCVCMCIEFNLYFVSYLVRLVLMQVIGNQPRCQYEDRDNQAMAYCVLTARYLLNSR